MSFLLIAATILGGIAALWFIWDKFRGRKSSTLDSVPSSKQLVEKHVDFDYPTDTGLLADLESQGYRTFWCERSKLERRLKLEGWEYVEEDGHQLTTGELLFLKKRSSLK